MQFDDFIQRVQDQARLDTPEEAVGITRAVLETLGERLDRKVRNGVAAQLPNELKEFLLARGEKTDRYDLPEFYNRVGARADLLASCIAPSQFSLSLDMAPDRVEELLPTDARIHFHLLIQNIQSEDIPVGRAGWWTEAPISRFPKVVFPLLYPGWSTLRQLGYSRRDVE